MLSGMQDMNELQANAWIYWQAVENGEKGNWWGLMQVLPKTPCPSLKPTHASFWPGTGLAYRIVRQVSACSRACAPC